MQINQLPTIPQAPANADVLAIEVNGITYKVSKQALAAAIAANISPANIGAFGRYSVSNTITDANDTSLYGSTLLQGSNCANLPSSTAGAYYLVEFFGMYQIASRHTSNIGVGEVWARYYANNQWYPWVRIDGLGAAAASDVSNLIIKQSSTLTTDISLNSLASTSYDVTITSPSGYKPIAALEGRVNGGIFAVTVNLINNTTARAYIINAGSAVRTGTGVTVDVLFIRDI